MRCPAHQRPSLSPSACLLLLSMLLIPACREEVPAEPTELGQQTEILWDSWGVPHIFASDSESLFYANGWAQMRSHGSLILRLYGEARGRAAEYWGEEYLDQDRLVRTLGVPVRAQEWAEAQLSPAREFLEAFVAGANDFCRENPDRIDEEVRVILPLTAADVMAHLQRTIRFSFGVPGALHVAQRALSSRPGSNGWAVAPARSASGDAMLLANPHLPWSGFFIWHEMHLVSPDVWVYGAALVGLPFVGIGFNRDLGWTHTVNTIDGMDLYRLRLAGDGYRWEGGTQPFSLREERLKVLGKDGQLREETFEVRHSVHGPVVAESGGQAVALRVTGLYHTDLFDQYWEMARAESLGPFERALQRLQMPLFTVIYADQSGHILSLFGGLTPVRPAGDWDWRGVVPGDTERTLWTETHAYGELPRVADPEAGWVQNANDPPWTTTLPFALNPDRFPAYLAPRGMSFRAQRSARMLQEDAQITLEEMVNYKNSTRVELADRILDELILELLKKEGTIGSELADVLQGWDRCTNAESRGAVLFQAFWEEYQGRLGGGSPFAVPWSETAPLETPAGLAAPELAAEALFSAAEALEKQYGSAAVPWGEVMRLQRGALDVPASGGPDELGVFRVLYFADGENGVRRALGGDSFIAAVEFSDPVRARILTVTGSSSDPASPHYSDQMDLYARRQMRDAWLARSEIEKHLESRETIHYSGRTSRR